MSEVDLEHRIALLRDVWLFSGCNDDEIERIAAMAEPRDVPVGTEVTAKARKASSSSSSSMVRRSRPSKATRSDA